MKKSLKYKYCAFLAVAATVCGVAWAVVWGPFHVSSVGPESAQTTLSGDAGAEYETAVKIFQIYVLPALVSPADRVKAIKNDYVRVVYYDGQIADFKIKRIPSFVPLEFFRTVPSANHKQVNYQAWLQRNDCGSKRITYQTGYWGSSAEIFPPKEEGQLESVVVTAKWISTGSYVDHERADCK
jgi:hypothetical protein